MSKRAAKRIGWRTLRLERVGSTQDVAREFAADPRHHGLVIRADEQTQGRGRRGAAWLTPPGACLLFSVLLFPPAPLRRPTLLTVLAAVAVCEAVAAGAKVRPVLKWPNDVLVNKRKVCGILIESSGQAAVVGIGLNVSVPHSFFEAALVPGAGSLAEFSPETIDPDALFESLLRQFDDSYAMLAHGNTTALEDRWRYHSGAMGQTVRVHTSAETRIGRLLDLRLDGVQLEAATGQTWNVAPEAILRLELESDWRVSEPRP
jgi:BirA family biotin operon repressor/biotin-[acetyl-CoA-carboxylase] ligase